jgi:ribose transport system permease protein
LDEERGLKEARVADGSSREEAPARVRHFSIKVLRGQGVVVALVLVTIFLAIFAPGFFTTQNLINVLRQMSQTAIAAAGEAVVIILAGIDLSVGSVLALAGVTAAVLSISGFGLPVGAIGLHWTLALTIALGAGAFVGLVNGLLITRLRISAIIATLATLTIVRGVVYTWTGNVPVYSGLPEAFGFIGRGYLGPVPVPVIITVVVFGVLWLVLNRTVAGRYIFAIGGNQEAARLSGVAVRRWTTIGYVISGICAAIAGIIVLGRLDSAQPLAGQGFELDVIAAVALGGVSLRGGRGSLGKVFVGALIIAMLSNGLVLMNVGPNAQLIIKGTVLAAAVAFDMWSERAEAK